MSQTLGVADHAAAAPSFGQKVKTFLVSARKAVVAFLATGVGVTFADSLSKFDFSHLTLGNLWSGLGAGLLSSVLVYAVRNEGSKLGLSPELIALISRIVNERLARTEYIIGNLVSETQDNVLDHVSKQVEVLKPRKAVRGSGGKFQPTEPQLRDNGDGLPG